MLFVALDQLFCIQPHVTSKRTRDLEELSAEAAAGEDLEALNAYASENDTSLLEAVQAGAGNRNQIIRNNTGGLLRVLPNLANANGADAWCSIGQFRSRADSTATNSDVEMVPRTYAFKNFDLVMSTPSPL